MLVNDHPFPNYHAIPKAELRAAYFWELDRMFLPDWEDPRRPWPRLRDFERAELLPRLGQPIFEDDLPPVAAGLYPPFLLLGEKPAGGETQVMGISKEDWGWFFAELQRCRREKSVIKDLLNGRWKNLVDEHGDMRLVFSINPKRPLEDVVEDIRAELKLLIRFPTKKPPPRGEDWTSRICDLLCLRLERSGSELEEAKKLLHQFIARHGLADLRTKKHWSIRRGRAKRALTARQRELERLQRREAEFDPNSGRYWLEQFHFSTWGSQHFGGGSEIGWQRPHRIKINGMSAPFLQKPFLHFLSLRKIILDESEVDWSDVWFEFEEWKKEHVATFVRLSEEGMREHMDKIIESAANRQKMSLGGESSASIGVAKGGQGTKGLGKGTKRSGRHSNSTKG